ncbi:MAG: FxLYD domain-containing protein [Rhodothermales bacterium]
MIRLAVLGMMMFALLAGCRSSSEDGDASQQDTVVFEERGAEGRVSIEEFGYMRSPEGRRFVRGRLKNDSSRYLRNAQVQVSLYDEDNRASGSMIVLVKDVEPGSEKAFQATVDREDAAGARVRAILMQ